MGRHSERKKSKKRSKDKRPPPKSSLTSSEDEWVEAEPSKKISENKEAETSFISEKSQKRDDWMDLPTSFRSISNVDIKDQRNHDKKIQEQLKQYDPSKSSRELNPYWKDGSGGLPTFKRPREDEGNLAFKQKHFRLTSNWKKNNVAKPEIMLKESSHPAGQSDFLNVDIISEKELNLLAAKIVKAEILGNTTLVTELTAKLEKARKHVELAKSEERHKDVLLTKTDSQGRSKPMKLKSNFETSNAKEKKRKIETHANNERLKYFADDDKYSLKEMFEEEKYNMPNDQDRDFMEVYSKIRKNDDLDDLFADTIRRKKSDMKTDAVNKSRAINEHKKMEAQLEACDLCIQSKQSQNHLIVSMGEYVYLSLPAHEPLTIGHCLLVPIRHVTCSTNVDENEWAELMEFRKALVRYFRSKNEEVVFFECSMMFHKYPHMVIECIPLPKENVDMAPMYFKKAIDESETDWAQNKKLVSLKGRDVRKAIPKGLPFFFVSFGLEEGYAHVIEDERIFPKNFAQEIIGGMLDLHHSKWLKPRRQMFKDQSERVVQFSVEWKDYDCTIKN